MELKLGKNRPAGAGKTRIFIDENVLSNQTSNGVNWNKKKIQKAKSASRTSGREKPTGRASQFARYCATKSRARYHKYYRSQCKKWDGIE